MKDRKINVKITSKNWSIWFMHTWYIILTIKKCGDTDVTIYGSYRALGLGPG